MLFSASTPSKFVNNWLTTASFASAYTNLYWSLNYRFHVVDKSRRSHRTLLHAMDSPHRTSSSPHEPAWTTCGCFIMTHQRICWTPKDHWRFEESLPWDSWTTVERSASSQSQEDHTTKYLWHVWSRICLLSHVATFVKQMPCETSSLAQHRVHQFPTITSKN